MVKDFKYIFRRILIGVGITLILGYIGSLTGFILPFNIYAMEKPDIVVGVDSTTNSIEPVYKNGLNSNVFKEDFNNSPNMQFGYTQYNVNINDLDTNNGISVPFWDSFTQLSNSLVVNYRVSNYSGYNTYVDSFHFNPRGNLLLNYNNHYTLLLFIEKLDNIDFMNGVPNISLDSFQYFVGNDNTLIEGKDYISNININFYRIYEKPSQPSEYAYILFDFDISSIDFPTYQDNIYLSDITLSSYIGNINGHLKLPLNYFLETHRVGNNDNGTFKVDFYFLENGVFNVPGVTCDPLTGSCHTGSQYSGVFDYTTASDISVLNTIETCSSDLSNFDYLICRIKNIFDMIYKFFVRISNILMEFLDSSFNVTLESNSDMTPVSNIINMPLTMLNKFITGFGNECYTFYLGSLLGTPLFVTCVDVEHYIGTDLWNKIDIFVSIFMCLNIMSLILMFVDKWTSLEDTFQLMYYPRHANTTEDYIPKHGGR